MVSPTVKALVDAAWVVWSIGASIYDYFHTNAMEQRIHALEKILTIHQWAIGVLSAGVLALFTYILVRNFLQVFRAQHPEMNIQMGQYFRKYNYKRVYRNSMDT